LKQIPKHAIQFHVIRLVVDHIMNDYVRYLKWHCLPSFNDIVMLYRLGVVEAAGEI